MKKNILTVILLLCTLLVFGQEEHSLAVFETDATWTKEIIKFPIGFAPDIPYEGYEDLRFAAGWAKKDSPEFWTYTFAWYINGNQKQTSQSLETNLKMYFDGLMRAVNKDKDFTVPATSVSFTESENKTSGFAGEVKVYDAFHTHSIIRLHILVTSYYCTENNTSILVFRISPKALDSEVWNIFKQVKIRMDNCKPF